MTASQSTKSQQTEKRLVILRDTDTLVRVIDWEINPALSIEWTRNFLLGSIGLKVSATLKIAIFSFLRFQHFQIDILESFLLKKKSEENIISIERYRG